jgi:hypothetical protein
MSSFYDDASLVVIPSGYKTSKVYAEKPTDGSGDLTFTRTGDTATRVNSAGLIEKVRTNLVLNSATFVTQTITVTANPHTLSFTGTGTIVITGVGSGTLVGTGASNRVSLSFTTTAGALILTKTGTVVLAQLETGDIATPYIPTSTAAVSVGPTANTARLDYLGSTCPRLLLEPQRTNLVTYSERFTSWLDAGGTVTSNTAISPDGYLNADTLTGARYQSGFASNQYTVSCFAKKVDGDGMFVLRLDAPTLFSAQFNLNTGTIVSTSAGYTSTITNFGNGWYRCTLTTPVSTTIANFVLVSATGATASTYIWGAQCEAGAYATSYIPTLASASTRSADACSKTGISSLIGQTEGTLYAEIVRTTSTATDGFWVGVNAGTVTDWIFFGIEATGARFYVRVNNVVVAEIYPTMGVGTHKMALGYKSGQIVGYIDGVQVFSSAGTFTLTSLTKFQIGATSPSTDTTLTTAAVKQALLFKTRLTNAEMQELTTL